MTRSPAFRTLAESRMGARPMRTFLHILNKLGVNTRAQIAAWVAARGLRIASAMDG